MHYRRPCQTFLLALAVAAWQAASAQSAAPLAPAQTTAPTAVPPTGADSHARPASKVPAAQMRGATAAHRTAASPAASSSRAAPTTDQRRYFVEIVIFRARVALGSPEDWQAETNMARTIAGGETPSGSAVGRMIDLLPSSRYHLTSVARMLRGSGTYTPIAHAAWEQTASAWGTHAGFTLGRLGIHVPGLSGQVFLERGQYLHLGMTLDYIEQHPPAGLGAAPGTTFVLNETRRIRYYRRNYYDNPAFGVIALVLPDRGKQPPGR